MVSASLRGGHALGSPTEYTQPNHGLQATANSLRSFLASAIGGA
jgi:hypothetical protein